MALVNMTLLCERHSKNEINTTIEVLNYLMKY